MQIHSNSNQIHSHLLKSLQLYGHSFKSFKSHKAIQIHVNPFKCIQINPTCIKISANPFIQFAVFSPKKRTCESIQTYPHISKSISFHSHPFKPQPNSPSLSVTTLFVVFQYMMLWNNKAFPHTTSGCSKL